MVLWHTQRIRIARRKEGLQILLDVVLCPDTVEHVEHAQCIIAPIRCLGHRQIIDAADLVQIDKAVRRFDDGQ